jgi:hypothetical protein
VTIYTGTSNILQSSLKLLYWQWHNCPPPPGRGKRVDGRMDSENLVRPIPHGGVNVNDVDHFRN